MLDEGYSIIVSLSGGNDILSNYFVREKMNFCQGKMKFGQGKDKKKKEFPVCGNPVCTSRSILFLMTVKVSDYIYRDDIGIDWLE